ncbi:protein kinase domain-containing protein [Colletotrichum musicola]|uniref:Protein kinase domain-containing protein n=1 Tax=Colletotrichum musicola TaxID=2175873 RepID=A0A8H6ND78_9PEZI|nr:protein kinase domain-containing protein [Colletotrichum musicola]
MPDPLPVDAGIDSPPIHPRDPFEHCRSISVNMAGVPGPGTFWPDQYLTRDLYIPDPGLNHSFSTTQFSASSNYYPPFCYSQPQPQNLGNQFGIGTAPANPAATVPTPAPPNTLAPDDANRGKKRSSGSSADQVPNKRPKPRQQRQGRQSRQPDSVTTPSPATTSEAATPRSCPEAAHDREDLFACPYFKHDRVKYGPGTKKWSLCGATGWKISRLKEHILRNHHTETYRCSRCHSKWLTAEKLDEHLRSGAPCPVLIVRDDDRVDLAQLNRIKDRMRGMNDSIKWSTVYRIIFPDEQEPIPSPYLEPTIDDFRSHLDTLFSRSTDHQERVKIQNCLEVLGDFLSPRSLSQSSTGSTQSDLPVLTQDRSEYSIMFGSPATIFKPSPSPETNMTALAPSMPMAPYWIQSKKGMMPAGDFQLYPDVNTSWQFDFVDEGCTPPPYAALQSSAALQPRAMLQPNAIPQTSVMLQPNAIPTNATLQPNTVVPGTFQTMPFPKASPDSSAGQLNPPWF